ncbi:MAG: LpxD N-terminal domain-containing protein, partial [Nitrosotalea sp.]
MVKKMNHQSEFNIKSMLSSQNIDFETEGDTKRKIKNISPITNAKPSDLSFCHYDGDKAIDLISKSKAGVILCKKSLRGLVHPRQGAQLIFLDKPRYVFVNLANKIFVKQKMIGIAPSAVISQTARIGDRCYIGEYTVIGDNCKIGNDTIIYDKVTLVKDCSIGNRCIIHSGIILGDDGFAFERDEENLYKFPHFGRVLIGDDVEICANSHIAKGSLSDTIINNGAKIDSLVHISHNVSVGKNCEITAGAIVGGSVKIGNSTWIG